MFSNVTPKKAVVFTKYSVTLCCGWPLPSSAPKSRVYFYMVIRVLSILCTVLVMIPAFWSLYFYIDDAVLTGKTFGLIASMCQTVTCITICSIQHGRYQRLIEEMTDCLEKAKLYETAIFQRYVDTYSSFHGMSTIGFYSAASFFVVATLFIDDPFPVITKYPFRVDYEPVRTTIYLNHVLAAYQNVSSVSINTLTALLLLFAAARFDIVMLELQSAVTVADLKKCLEKYREVKRYAQDTINVIQYVTLSTILFSSVILVNAGLNIIGRREFAIKCQYTVVAITGLMEVFSCVLPADRLIEVSAGAIQRVYDIKWYERDLSVQKTVYHMLVPQKPVIVSFLFVVPQLSLNYYCSYISNSCSLFAALRLLLDEPEDVPSYNNLNTTCCYN